MVEDDPEAAADVVDDFLQLIVHWGHQRKGLMLKGLITVIAICESVLVMSLSIAKTKKAKKTPFVDLNLSEEQVGWLNNIFEKYRSEGCKRGHSLYYLT